MAPPPRLTAPTPPSPSSIIRFKLSDIDTVMSSEKTRYTNAQSPFVASGELHTVPVIRIFGATDRGKRVMAHIHGAFPYVYIKYLGKSLEPDVVNAYIHRLARSLNLAMDYINKGSRDRDGRGPNGKGRPPPPGPGAGGGPPPPAPSVAFIVPCKGIPFYGYHVGYEPFLKIYITKPSLKIRLSETLRSGVIMKTKFDVFEDHAPFLLQFMLDCDLYGCGWVEVDECRFRKVPEHEWTPSDDLDPPSITGPYHTRVYNSESVPTSLRHPSHDDDSPQPVSTCPIEIDVPVHGISNRHKIRPREIQQDFVELLRPPGSSSAEEKLVLSLRELWVDERRRREAAGEQGPGEVTDSTPRKWDERTADEPVWADEPRLREKFEKLLDEDRKAYRARPGFAGRSPEFETFVEERQTAESVQRGFLARLRSTFDQVDAVFLPRLEEDRKTGYEYGALVMSKYDFGTGQKARTRAGSTRPMSEDFDEAKFAATQAQIERVVEEDEQLEMLYEEEDLGTRGVDQFNTQHFERLKRRARERQGLMGWAEDVEEEDEEDAEEAEEDIGEDLFEQEVDDEDDRAPEPPLPPPAQPNGHADMGELGSEDDVLSAHSSTLGDHSFRLRAHPKPIPIAFESTSPEPIDEQRDFAQTFAKRPSPVRGAPNPGASSSSRTASRSPTKQNYFRSPEKVVKIRRASTTSGDSSASGSAYGSADEEEDHVPVLTLREHDTQMDEHDSSLPPVQQPQASSTEDGDLEEEVPPEMFEDYVPTPTQIEPPAPSLLPPHLRSFIDSDDELTLSPLVGINGKRSRESSVASDDDNDEPASSLENPPPTKRALRFDTSQTTTTTMSSEDLVVPVQPSIEFNVSSGTATSSVVLPPPPPPLPQASYTSSTSSGPLLRPEHPLSASSWIYGPPAPNKKQVLDSLESFNQPRVDYQNPYYSNPADVPRVPTEYGGRRFVLRDHSMRNIPDFAHFDRRLAQSEALSRSSELCGAPRKEKTFHARWEYAKRPPPRKKLIEWVRKEEMVQHAKETIKRRGREIEGPTQHQGGFKFTQMNGAPSQREKQHMAVLAMELHVNTRENFLPHPKFDAIEAIFYCLQSENDDVVMNGRLPDTHVGCIAVRGSPEQDLKRVLGPTDFAFEVVETELEMIASLMDKIVHDWDPEALAGYEVHHSSWGYLLERAKDAHDWNLVAELGRMEVQSTGRHGNAQSDRWGFSQTSTLKFTGRHVLPIWRILSSDNRLQHAAFEHVAFQVLKQRTPHFSHKTLTQWYTSGNPRYIAKVLEYWRNRVEMDIEMLEAAEVIEQNCESARVFGVDFRSVRTRGSQFKVEAVMFKLAKPESFVLLSPNRIQVGQQNAAEHGPLIMEPQSAFYKGPLVVLDFQSLYPSVMIAYNYCYSTCLGRIERFKQEKKFGTTTLDPPPGLLELMKDHIIVSPNGMMFVKPQVRRSLLAKMLSELLDTRVMVKSSMKRVQDDRALTKLLNARQLALKFLANVTYGYTSATFSGRMPCVEIADAIVQTGRETLEKAIVTVKSRADWGAEVVYGDTDSLFIYLPGKSKDDAFRIGHEMAETITSMNPRPIRLKFEKVYLPCVLLAKKRYVGFKYEYPAQVEPDFDAKGIETVRRDGIAATQKMQEACLKMLFRSQDLSIIKAYLQRQWKKLLIGDVSPQDFIYAKAVKLGSYAEGRAPPPGAMVSQRAIKADPRAEPEYGERVPYILFQSAPGERQIDRALSPHEFLADPRLRLDAVHYIQNAIIPPLARIFNLVGVDITQWFKQMPRSLTVVHARSAKPGAAKALLEEYLKSDRCRACGESRGVDEGGLCKSCQTRPGEVLYTMHSRLRAVRSRQMALRKICASCSSAVATEEIECDSIDCPLMWERKATGKEFDDVAEVMRLLS